MSITARVCPDARGWGYEYAVDLPMIGGPRHGRIQEFQLVSTPSAGALTAQYRLPETLPNGDTRWDVYAIQRNEHHEPVAFLHEYSFVWSPRPRA